MMKMTIYIFSFVFSVVFVCVSAKVTKNRDETVLKHVWWGPKDLQQKNDSSIRPFKVEFTKEMITDLQQRLRNHRPFTPPLEGVGFEYGFNTDFLENWVQYWANGYDFKAREDYLNQFPQYKTNIQGLDIHFLWSKPQVNSNIEVVPLLFLHGWPGGIREVYDAIPFLGAVDGKRNFALEIVAPSLPGFGFSDAAVRPDLGAIEIAVVLRNLMRRLGFKQFYVQGGDWGSVVGSHMSTLYPEEVLGFHTNFALSTTELSLAWWALGSLKPSAVVEDSLRDRLYPFTTVLFWLIRETGYLHIHATKPDSIGVAMGDSPAGLLAYVLQLISSGTRKNNTSTLDGGLEEHYSRDSLLDILTIMWATNSFTTSSRIYAESVNFRTYNTGILRRPTAVPTWTVHAKNEIFYETPPMLQLKFKNLLNSTVLDDFGHFLALEVPLIFSEDVLKAIKAFRNWHDMRKSV